ncbi:hypothetical protein [Vibrio sp. 03_296]|uniref:hypothetical protein n=1 Tax=Vibrio sp. 03_296 TaxID=2024409 RepID=UPI002D7EBF02|nr:hypothetical protein [Vibrio sp. 03_296]
MKLINGCIATLAGLSLSAGAWAQESSRILVEQELMAVANDLIQSAELRYHRAKKCRCARRNDRQSSASGYQFTQMARQ